MQLKKVAVFFLFLLAFSCGKSKRSPLVTTLNPTELTNHLTVCGGVVYEEGDSPITAKGVCWSTKINPEISDSKTDEGPGSSSFSTTITEISVSTLYHFRAYAINKYGVSYGSDMVMLTKPNEPIPELLNVQVFNLDSTSAIAQGSLGASVNIDGIIETGFCWSNSGNIPTLDSNHLSTSMLTPKQFTAQLSQLHSNTSYTVRAYARNSSGTGYSPAFSLKTLYGYLTDINNNNYKLIQIGSQIWMAENLRVTRYNDGVAIPYMDYNNVWSQATTGYFCYYNGENDNQNKFGNLYNTYVVQNSLHDIAPPGWHIPTEYDWQVLITYLNITFRDNPVGALRLPQYWQNPLDATNETGFSAIPGGYRYYNGSYYGINNYAYFWATSNIVMSIRNDNTKSLSQATLSNGLSIRLVKD